MGRKLSRNQLDLYKRLDELLFYQWDPIGISTDEDWPTDEYQAYLPRVFSMLLEFDDPKPIADYLSEVSTKSMGLSLQSEADLRIAKLALKLKEQCQVK
jgi:hypothetical protein